MIFQVDINGEITTHHDKGICELIPGRQQTAGYGRIDSIAVRCVLPWTMEGEYNERASLITGRVIRGTAFFVPR
jgi:hypothetical protein